MRAFSKNAVKGLIIKHLKMSVKSKIICFMVRLLPSNHKNNINNNFR